MSTSVETKSSELEDYSTKTGSFDEILGNSKSIRNIYNSIMECFTDLSGKKLTQREKRIHYSLRDRGVTFESDVNPDKAIDQTLKVDPLPRVIKNSKWENYLKPGLFQRLKTLNAFLHDIYHDAQILRDGVIPISLVLENDSFHRRIHGISPPGGVYTHIAGLDLVRDQNGTYRVLEDNLQIPSGVSYMLENRRIMTEIFPGLINRCKLKSVDHYPDVLMNCLKSVTPNQSVDSTVVLLTPGPYNDAYFEHVYLARSMGIELVKGDDLIVKNNKVWLDLPQGPKRVDVIYRRIDTEFLDPAAFRSDSLLGVPGLIDAYEQGNVVIANAPGAGVADDKAIYSFVPEMIEYYLDEEPILPNVPTYLGRVSDDRQHILDNIDELTVKRVDGAGGYGMLIGPTSSREEIKEFIEEFKKEPHNYIAQPTLDLSTHPCYVTENQQFEPRHIDLRPFVLFGSEGPAIVPGGLTRVALEEGSLVVNSSQGGGSKDTWVME